MPCRYACSPPAGQEDRLARLQDRVPQQQRRDHAEVTRVLRARAGPPPRRPPRTGRRPPRPPRSRAATSATSAARRSGGQARMAASASVSASGPLAAARIAVTWSSWPTPSSFSSAAASCGDAHAGQRLEAGQRAQDLGLGPVVDVVAGLVGRGETALVLGQEPGLGLLPRRVHLDGQRRLGREHLAAGTAAARRTGPPTPGRARRPGRPRSPRPAWCGRRRAASPRTARTDARPSTAPPRVGRSGRVGPEVRRWPCGIPTRTACVTGSRSSIRAWYWLRADAR